MPVSVCQGDPIELVTPTVTIGSSTHTFPLNNTTWWILATLELTWSATATVGSRLPQVFFKDAAGNSSTVMVNPTGPTAGAQLKYSGGSLQQQFSANATLGLSAPYPVMISPGSSLVVQDQAGIDPNDGIQVTAVFTQ